jgi:hypothetical protein
MARAQIPDFNPVDTIGGFARLVTEFRVDVGRVTVTIVAGECPGKDQKYWIRGKRSN